MTDEAPSKGSVWKVIATISAVIFFAFLALAILAPGSPATPDAPATLGLSDNPIVRGVGIGALFVAIVCAWIGRSVRK